VSKPSVSEVILTSSSFPSISSNSSTSSGTFFVTNFVGPVETVCVRGGTEGAAGAGGGLGGGGAAEPRELSPSATPGILDKGTHSATPSNQTKSLKRRLPAFK
jgi:hypothetical protein